MARRTKKEESLMEKLAKHATNTLPEQRQAIIAKKTYLVEHKDEIMKAMELGYPYATIADVATEELLKTGIFTQFVVTTKEGEEKTVETKFHPIEIKKFCEPEGEV